MKIYRMIPNYDLCRDFSPGLFPGRDTLGNAMFRSEPLQEKWSVLRVSERSTTTKTSKADFVRAGWTYAQFGVNPRAAKVLRPALEGCCEFLPFLCEKKRYWVLNVFSHADCLDVRRTVFNGLDETPRNVIVAAFDPAKLPRDLIFRVTCGHDYYAKEPLKNLIEEAGLTGLRFQFMWSDDGSEPEEIADEPEEKPRKRRKRKVRPATKEDLLLERLWRDIILSRTDPDELEKRITMSRLGGGGRYDSTGIIRRLARAGVSKQLLMELAQAVAYEVVFEVLVTLEEEIESFPGLHESLLIAEPD